MSHRISVTLRSGAIGVASLGFAIASLSAGAVLAGPHGAGASLGGSSGVNGNFGGASASHISASGLAHTNGPAASDRDFGADRSSDRAHSSTSKTNSNSNSPSSTDRDHGQDRAADRAHLHGKP